MSKQSIAIGFLLAVLLSVFPQTTSAKTIRVPLDKPTIQAAIDVAKNGDVIIVSPGIYVENIDFLGKAIHVRSQRGARQAIIDGGAKGSVVTFASGEGPASVLSGFVIRNGRSGFDTPGFGDGGGIRIEDSSPTIRDNVIKNNRACVGVGISISFGSPVVQGNLITGNIQAGCSGGIGGGGISIGGVSTAKILDNIIAHNTMESADGGGISLFAGGTPKISGNIIKGNVATGLSPCAAGGGIAMVNHSDALIVQNLITGNSAGCGGGISWLVPAGSRGPLLVNNTIKENSSAMGSGIFADGYDARARLINNLIIGSAGQAALLCGDFNDNNPPVMQFNDIFSRGHAAYDGICKDLTGVDGNISADPLFVAKGSEEYHISRLSPAVDAGNNEAAGLCATDFDGALRIQDGDQDGTAVVDMGVDEVTPLVAASGRTAYSAFSISSKGDELSDTCPPAVGNQKSGGDHFHQARSDARIAVFAYDVDGNPVTYTDAGGVKTAASSAMGKSGSR